MSPRSSTKSPQRRGAYEAKRNLAKSPEPGWHSRKSRGRKNDPHRFVIQKHAARRLHYDLRLEINGALVSWAVPKGIPDKPGDKHLAVKVEDHPLDYAEFEGNIPAGNYGAGSVMIWDRGLYQVLEKDPAAAVKNGHLSLVFAGEKLEGDWKLIRTRTEGDKEQWLIIKGKERPFKLSPRDEDRSVASDRSLDEIARDSPPETESPQASSDSKSSQTHLSDLTSDLPKASPAFADPMKPHLTPNLPRSGNWIFEIKFDGYRMIAVKDGKRTTLYSRNHKDVSKDFSDIRDAIAQLPVKQAVIDGEIVALMESGISSFQLLQNRARSGGRNAPPMFCYAFDLLNLNGKNTTGLPLHQRKSLLQNLLEEQSDPLRFSAGIDTDPQQFLDQARKIGLEGILAKEANSTYQIGRRTRSWLKIKLHHEQEFVIGGYTEPKGSRSRFGAILIGLYEGQKLKYIGRVGTGFNEQMLEDAFQLFQKLRTEKPPFFNLPAPRRGSFSTGLTATEMKRCVWLKPQLVCQIRFSEWTDDDSIRHPVFIAFRDDKSPSEIKKEDPLK